MSDLVNITGLWRPRDRDTGKVRTDTTVRFSGFLREDVHLEKDGKILIFQNKKFKEGSRHPEFDVVYAPPDEKENYRRQSKTTRSDSDSADEGGDEDEGIPF